MVGRNPRSKRADNQVDPVTGKSIEKLMVNPLVRGDTEEHLDPFEVRVWFDELRKMSGLASAKEAIPDWEDYTLPGDPYPSPRKIRDSGPTTEAPFKGASGYLVNTDDEGWEQKLIAKVRERAGQNSD